MGKITSKLQITLPKAIAERFGLKPGDDVDFVPAGEVIRLEPRARSAGTFARETRLDLFDQATARQAARDANRPRSADAGREWTRDELYDRGRPH